MDLEAIPFAFHDCLHEVAAHMRPMASNKKIKLTLLINNNTPRYVEGDPTRFRQILYNIMDNAIKFTKKGHVSVTVTPLDAEYPNPTIQLQIEDTGIGIAAKRKQMIFDSFTQADTSTTRRYGGTGLGLSICARIITLMGGDISLESEENKGSIFTINLPLKSANKPTTILNRRTTNQNNIEPLEILVVEDNPVNQEVAQIRLSKMGHHVVMAESGPEAIELFRNMQFDLVFMDMQMPDMNGITTTKELRKIEEERDTRTPIIAMSARATEDDNNECQEAGMDGYITKPFGTQTLLKTLQNLGVITVAADTGNDGIPALIKNVNFTSFINKLGQEEREDLISAGQIYLSEYKKDCSNLFDIINILDRPKIEYFSHRIRGGTSALGDSESSEVALWLEVNHAEASKATLFNKAKELAKNMDRLAQEIKDIL